MPEIVKVRFLDLGAALTYTAPGLNLKDIEFDEVGTGCTLIFEREQIQLEND